MLNKRADIGIWRSIKVDRLRKLLVYIPGDCHIVVSKITGGLVLLRGEAGDEDNWEPVGLIDISDESLVFCSKDGEDLESESLANAVS